MRFLTNLLTLCRGVSLINKKAVHLAAKTDLPDFWSI